MLGIQGLDVGGFQRQDFTRVQWLGMKEYVMGRGAGVRRRFKKRDDRQVSGFQGRTLEGMCSRYIKGKL